VLAQYLSVGFVRLSVFRLQVDILSSSHSTQAVEVCMGMEVTGIPWSHRVPMEMGTEMSM